MTIIQYNILTPYFLKSNPQRSIMITIVFKYTKYFTTALFILITSSLVNAQKLPTLQQNSLKLPANTKIDGKATEWNNHFQAYNKSTQTFYSIANDANTLYLIIQAKDPDIITKILIGGVTFTVNASAAKADSEKTAITFPIYGGNKSIIYSLFKNKPVVTKNLARNKIQADSFVNSLNNQLTENLKMIGLYGAKTITDSLISIYNDHGIKAKSFFDGDCNYTVELLIPIKYIGIDLANQGRFSYNIKLSGAELKNGKTQFSPSGRFILIYNAAGKPVDAIPVLPQTMITSFATNFSGEYILAK